MGSEDAGKNLMSYLRQADATLRNGFESEELKQIFLKNTIEEISGEEISLCLQKSSSFILENMIREADMDIVLQFFESILKDECWTKVACSQGGCHILEALSERFVVLLQNASTESEYKLKLSEMKHLLKVDEESITTAMSDTYATHAFRSHIHMLGGVKFAKKNSKPEHDLVINKESIPKGFLKTLQKICRCLCDINPKKFLELLSDVHASPCISGILKVLRARQLPKTLKRLSHKIFSCCHSDGVETSSLIVLMKDKNGSHVVESLLENGDDETRENITNLIISDQTRFFELCSHPIANFVIQKMILNISDENHFRTLLDFVLEGLEDILADQNYGVIHSLAEQCITHTSCQEKFFDSLLEAFHCRSIGKRTYIVTLLATLTAYEAFLKTPEEPQSLEEIPAITNVEYHGSLLLQTLLKFDNVGLIIKSICEIPVGHVVAIACNVNGSHFIDAFYASPKVKLRKKREFLKKLKENSINLACDKYGSRVLENIWNGSEMNEKKIIAEELATHSEKLSGDQFGKFILRKFNLLKYQKRQEEWEQLQKQNTNKRKLFANIVSDLKRGKRQRI